MYTFFIDEKVTIWRRNRYEVDANSYEEALGKMTIEVSNPTYDDEVGFIDSEFLLETEEFPNKRELCDTNKLTILKVKL